MKWVKMKWWINCKRFLSCRSGVQSFFEGIRQKNEIEKRPKMEENGQKWRKMDENE